MYRRPELTTRGHGFTYPDKPRPDDRVAVLSPSMGLPAVFPTVYEQGLRRIREVFGLVPVEYPTTRTMNAPLRERACDVHAAFADPTVKAIITSIGGEDQIKLLRYLDPELIGAHPKPFFGYSDNTNLHVFLWNLGIVSYHGGSVMVQLGRGGAMHPYTAASLRQALFERGEAKISPAPEYTDEDLDWAESGTLTREPPMFTNPGWTWLNEGRIVEGIAWGGSLEIVDFHLRAGKYLSPPDAYEGAVLPGDLRGVALRHLRLPRAHVHGRARATPEVPRRPRRPAEGLVPRTPEHGQGKSPVHGRPGRSRQESPARVPPPGVGGVQPGFRAHRSAMRHPERRAGQDRRRRGEDPRYLLERFSKQLIHRFAESQRLTSGCRKGYRNCVAFPKISFSANCCRGLFGVL